MAQKKDSVTGKWMYYGSYININNKRIQYKKRGFESKKLARKAEDYFRDHIENPISTMSFKEVANEYWKTESKINKETTHNDTRLLIGRIGQDIGNKLLCELNQEVLQAYIDKLDSKYSQQYVSKLYYTINKVMRYAEESKYIIKNPLNGVIMDARKNEIKESFPFWEPGDFKKFIGNVDDEMYSLLFSFLYSMGTRRGETLALTWDKIDFENKTVHINRSVATKLNNKIVTPKTGNSIRTISMPNNIMKMMEEWKEYQQTLYEFSEERFVFGYHKVIAAETLRRNFKKYIKITNENLKTNKIPEIRIHDLRHSHASYLINNMSKGFTDFDIAKRLGDTVSTLHSTYAHWFKAADSNIMDFMNNDK